MVDPILSLALSMHSNPGVYALLLGSGISRSASIPTGWEVVLDLVRKIAALENDNPEPDPESWFAEKHGCQPTYSGLLEMIAKSQAERSRLLRAYFEPTDDEREQGQKVPTKAHHAIAQLVKSGVVRVIVTTNFDRLLENAFDTAGVHATVIRSPDDIQGAMPIVHNECTVIKVHGDYLDLRTRNTPTELDQYETAIDSVLERVLDEFGLVVCGWSAEWDAALRRALERSAARRFTTYWTARGNPTEAAAALVKHRRAQIIDISDADTFFTTLSEKINALADLNAPHPLSIKIAIAQTKKYLVDPKFRIQLHDLLMTEIETITREINGEHFPVQGTFDDSDVSSRIANCEALSEVAIGIAATGGYWGENEHHDLWVKSINYLANATDIRSGNTRMLALRMYPAILLQYAIGVGAAAMGHFETILAILARPKKYKDSVEAFFPTDALRDLPQDLFKVIEGSERLYLARTERLHVALREPLRHLIPNETDYDIAFDTFETLQSLEGAGRAGWAIPGAFMYRYYTFHGDRRIARRNGSPFLHMMEDVNKNQSRANILSAGFLQGSVEQWDIASSEVDKMSMRYH